MGFRNLSLINPKDFPNDNFSVRWEGQIKIDQSSKYTFYTISDDGVKLFINGKNIINNWQAQPATENKGSITLQGSSTYPIVIEYFEDSGGEAMILGWESENFNKKLITSENLVTNDGKPGLKGTYYRNKALKYSKKKKPVIRIDKEFYAIPPLQENACKITYWRRSGSLEDCRKFGRISPICNFLFANAGGGSRANPLNFGGNCET